MAKTTKRAWLTPDDESGAAICRPLLIPPAFLTTLTGTLEDLALAWNWEQWGNLTPEDCASAMRVMLDTFYEGCQMTIAQQYLRLILPQAKKLSGNADTWSSGSSQYLAGVWESTTAVQNDEWQWKPSLKAGTYHIKAMAEKNNNAGKPELKIDGVSQGTIDLYNSSFAANQLLSFSDYTLANDAEIDIRLKVATKNAASSGYRVILSEIWIFPSL